MSKKIAILGTGSVGQIIAEKLTQLEHEVILGTRSVANALARSTPDNFGRPPLKEWHQTHKDVKLGTFHEAAAWGEFIINATSGGGTLEALKLAGEENLNGKIMLDISNPLDFSKGMPPSLLICNTDSLAEQIQRTYPKVKVVKSLNTMTASIMVNPSLIDGEHNVFMSGNDEEAKGEVRKLLNAFGWKNTSIIDMGDITTARGTEMLLPVWIRLMGALNTPIFNFHINVAS